MVINRIKSTWQNVESGVPQGSVLGPLLFLIYVNDLEIGINTKIWKFADDVKIVKSIESVDDNFKIQKSLDKLSVWATNWDMNFNIAKCKSMHIGKHNNNFSYE